jgi:Inositol 1,3,4-trisphosphate 5/6-kinase ATP-grasp domain/Inositol 1,3,4-trisphosphate 5/6-kinase pre-ATP-grasp domain
VNCSAADRCWHQARASACLGCDGLPLDLWRYQLTRLPALPSHKPRGMVIAAQYGGNCLKHGHGFATGRLCARSTANQHRASFNWHWHAHAPSACSCCRRNTRPALPSLNGTSAHGSSDVTRLPVPPSHRATISAPCARPRARTPQIPRPHGSACLQVARYAPDTIFAAAAARDLDIVILDVDADLAPQGPFDAILHKLHPSHPFYSRLAAYRADESAADSSADSACRRRRRRLVVLDEPERVARVQSRASMLEAIGAGLTLSRGGALAAATHAPAHAQAPEGGGTMQATGAGLAPSRGGVEPTAALAPAQTPGSGGSGTYGVADGASAAGLADWTTEGRADGGAGRLAGSGADRLADEAANGLAEQLARATLRDAGRGAAASTQRGGASTTRGAADSVKDTIRITVPPSCVIPAGASREAVDAAVARAGLRYPLLCKSLAAEGSPASHGLALFLDGRAIEVRPTRLCRCFWRRCCCRCCS